MKTKEEINELWGDVRKLMIEYAVNISTDECFGIMIGYRAIDVLKEKYDLRLKKDSDKRFTEEDYKSLQLLDKRIEGLIYDIQNDYDKETAIGRLKAMKGQSSRILQSLNN